MFAISLKRSITGEKNDITGPKCKSRTKAHALVSTQCKRSLALGATSNSLVLHSSGSVWICGKTPLFHGQLVSFSKPRRPQNFSAQMSIFTLPSPRGSDGSGRKGDGKRIDRPSIIPTSTDHARTPNMCMPELLVLSTSLPFLIYAAVVLKIVFLIWKSKRVQLYRCHFKTMAL
jgi:hypothetical protein